MRLSADQVKQAILHDDRDVRDAAVYYFARSFSTDPSIMPLAIQAIEQHGWKDAFEFYFFMKDLVQTDETVRWLIEQIRIQGQPDDEYGYVHAIRSALVQADANLLKQHDDTIVQLDELDQKSKDRICQRLMLASQSPSNLWLQLDDFCQQSDKLNTVPNDLDLADDLVEALGRYPEFSSPRVLAVLTGKPADTWMELSMVRLAGELRLEEAIPNIIVLLDKADDWIFEEGYRSLSKIGSDKVVDDLAHAYPAGSRDLRSSAVSILENVHTELSAETCLKWFEGEENHHIRCSLLQAILLGFSPAGIEPARQFVLTTPLDPDVLEVRSDLLIACKVLGERFPEFDAWTEDAKNDTAFRKNWYRMHPLIPDLDCFDLDDDDELDDDVQDESAIVQAVRIGRNDPCPCGSGKKFKKCCLNKGSTAI